MVTEEQLVGIAEAARRGARVNGETVIELVEEVRRQRRMIDHLLDLRRPVPAWIQRRPGSDE